MKGFMSVEIPTKRYIKAYVLAQLGQKPRMTQEHHIGSKLYDVLQHKLNEDRTRFSNQRYNDKLRLYISMHVFATRGGFLNESNIKSFNSYLEYEIKSRYRFMMDFYMEFLPSFEMNLPQIRRTLGIDEEDWSSDSIKKDYYRYRLQSGKPLLYNTSKNKKMFSASVPSGNFADAAF